MEIAKSLQQNEATITKCIDYWRRVYLIMGEAFNNIKEGNQWQGTEATSWHEYCDKYWGFKHAQVSNFIKVYKVYGKEIAANPDFQSIKMTRLVESLPFVTDSNKMEILHTAAREPTAQGWANTVRNMRGLKATDDQHAHNWELWEHCTECPAKRKAGGTV